MFGESFDATWPSVRHGCRWVCVVSVLVRRITNFRSESLSSRGLSYGTLCETWRLVVRSGRLLLLALTVFPAFASPEEESKEDREPFEAEFVASDIFRSGSLVLPLVRRFAFEGHYFGGKETDTGYTGVSWTLARKALKLVPGRVWRKAHGF